MKKIVVLVIENKKKSYHGIWVEIINLPYRKKTPQRIAGKVERLMNKETGKLQRKVFNAPLVLFLKRFGYAVYRVADQHCFIKLNSLRLNSPFEKGAKFLMDLFKAFVCFNMNIDTFWFRENNLHENCVEKNTTHFKRLEKKWSFLEIRSTFKT